MYDLVEDTNLMKQPDLKVVLKEFVEGTSIFYLKTTQSVKSNFMVAFVF